MKKLAAKFFYKIFNPIFKEIYTNRLFIKIGNGFSKGNASSVKRSVSLNDPASWEFSGFSQNGEDGIIEILLSQLSSSNRYFIEIGASNCIDNNTAWLAYVKNYAGLMIEGDSNVYQSSISIKPWYVDYQKLFVNLENISLLNEWATYKDPDLFSLDIDGNDYYIAKKFFEMGFRPKVIACEYNSAFGPDKSITIQYKEAFQYNTAHGSGLYYGVSVSAWKTLFKKYGYRFVTVDLNGVNAFFVNPEYFNKDFIENIKGLHFTENLHQYRKFKANWEKQFAFIENMEFQNIE